MHVDKLHSLLSLQLFTLCLNWLFISSLTLHVHVTDGALPHSVRPPFGLGGCHGAGGPSFSLCFSVLVSLTS